MRPSHSVGQKGLFWVPIIVLETLVNGCLWAGWVFYKGGHEFFTNSVVEMLCHYDKAKFLWSYIRYIKTLINTVLLGWENIWWLNWKFEANTCAALRRRTWVRRWCPPPSPARTCPSRRRTCRGRTAAVPSSGWRPPRPVGKVGNESRAGQASSVNSVTRVFVPDSCSNKWVRKKWLSNLT